LQRSFWQEAEIYTVRSIVPFDAPLSEGPGVDFALGQMPQVGHAGTGPKAMASVL